MTLMIFHKELNIYAFVGIIMLIGIVKKNAIMMIDFALEAERKEGKRPLDAIFEGAVIRFRPIMMTTMAALMGTLPIAIGIGCGRGGEAAAGARRCRGSVGIAAPDPVYHAGCLLLHGQSDGEDPRVASGEGGLRVES